MLLTLFLLLVTFLLLFVSLFELDETLLLNSVCFFQLFVSSLKCFGVHFFGHGFSRQLCAPTLLFRTNDRVTEDSVSAIETTCRWGFFNKPGIFVYHPVFSSICDHFTFMARAKAALVSAFLKSCILSWYRRFCAPTVLFCAVDRVAENCVSAIETISWWGFFNQPGIDLCHPVRSSICNRTTLLTRTRIAFFSAFFKWLILFLAPTKLFCIRDRVTENCVSATETTLGWGFFN